MLITEVLIAVLLGILVIVISAYITHFSLSSYKVMKQRLETGDYVPEQSRSKTVFTIILYAYFALSVFVFTVNMVYRTSPIVSNCYYVSIRTDSMSQAISANTYLKEHNLTNQIPQYAVASFDISKKNDINLYDIILFKKGDTLIAHRIVEITNDGNYITQGDKNIQRDSGEVDPNDVLGKYSHTLEFMTFINYLGYTPGFYIALVGVTYIIGVNLFFDVKKAALLKNSKTAD